MRPLLAPLAAALTLLCSTYAPAEVKPGSRPLDFQGKTTQGEPFRLAQLRGKVVLIDFWASWCEPCKKELPLLHKMAQRLRGQGIEIVTINIDDDPANAQAFMRQKRLEGLTVVADTDKHIVDKFEPPKMPSSFLLDKNGVVRAVNAGFDEGDEAKLEQQLKGLADK